MGSVTGLAGQASPAEHRYNQKRSRGIVVKLVGIGCLYLPGVHSA